MDKKKKEIEEIERKLKKQISVLHFAFLGWNHSFQNRHQHELKSFTAAQLKEYKFNKEQERHVSVFVNATSFIFSLFIQLSCISFSV